MIEDTSAILQWIDSQAQPMVQRLIEWAHINTGSYNTAGLDRFRETLQNAFVPLGGTLSVHNRSLSIIKRPESKTRVFLCIHMDTVYPPDHPFQTCTRLNDQTLQGPGVADAKGGLLVMLTALTAFEKSPLAQDIGWEVLINPDEEIGSMESAPLLAAAASRNHVGLLFEPATPDGALIDRRKGSGNFQITVSGRSVHAGRDFAQGRNAVVAVSKLAVQLHELNQELNGIILNIGRVEGGGPTNVVPNSAAVHFNVRTSIPEDEDRVMNRIQNFIHDLNQQDGFSSQLRGQFHSPPKIPDANTRKLMRLIESAAGEINLPIHWKPSGGACDGNKLAAAGLPNIDTLGPCGGNLHGDREFVLVNTLAERAKLALLVLIKLAQAQTAF